MKTLLTLIFTLGTWSAQAMRCSDYILNPNLHLIITESFGLPEPFLVRDPARGRATGLRPVEQMKITRAYDSVERTVKTGQPSEQIHAAVWKYYEAVYSLAKERDKKANQPGGIEPALILHQEALMILSYFASRLINEKTPKTDPMFQRVMEHQLENGFLILQYGGLNPRRVTIHVGREEFPAVAWDKDRSKPLGLLAADLENYEPGKTYQTVFSPHSSMSSGGGANISSNQSPRRPEMMSVSAKSVATLDIDYSVKHELRHAEVFRLLSTLTSSHLLTRPYAISRPLRKPGSQGPAYTLADELYTLIASVRGATDEARLALQKGDSEGAKFALGKAGFFASAGEGTADLLYPLVEESNAVVNALATHLQSKAVLPSLDTLTMGYWHGEDQVIYQVGIDDTLKLGFTVQKNLLGEKYVTAFVTNQGRGVEYVMLEKEVVALAEAYVEKVTGKTEPPELGPEFSELLAALQTHIHGCAKTYAQYYRAYYRIVDAYNVAVQAQTKENFDKLAAEIQIFDAFTPSFTPEVP